MPRDSSHAWPSDADSTPRRPLNLRQIEVFRAIMSAGSLSGAGRELNVSQPAISRVLAITESRLGFKLFERVKSRVLPTPEAKRLFAEVELVYGGIQRVNDLAVTLAHAGDGVLKVASSASFGQRLLPTALAFLRARNPRARIDYRSATFDELTGHLLVGRVQVGVSMVAPDHPHLVSVEVGRADIVCVMQKTHPLAALDCVTPEDLASTSWIGYPSHAPLGRALAGFLNMGHAAIEVHTPVSACALVEQGLGVALVDTWCLTPDMHARLAIRPITPPAAVRIWAIHSSADPLPLLARRFLVALGQAIDAEPPSNFVRRS